MGTGVDMCREIFPETLTMNEVLDFYELECPIYNIIHLPTGLKVKNARGEIVVVSLMRQSSPNIYNIYSNPTLKSNSIAWTFRHVNKEIFDHDAGWYIPENYQLIKVVK